MSTSRFCLDVFTHDELSQLAVRPVARFGDGYPALMKRVPHRRNAAGDFYVEEGCSVICGTCEAIAPDLFSVDDEHCFVKRQPSTDRELDDMVEAMDNSCVACIRWKGRDPRLRQRLLEAGLGLQVDDLR